MSTINKATFNLKAVVQETGLKPDTLRAWERRYGLPAPQRTSGGHRLYSQRDIDILKWLMARQDEGLSISRAVNMWKRYETEGHDPLIEVPIIAPNNSEETPFAVIDAISTLRQSWIKACKQFDERRANHILAQAFALYPIDLVCLELLQKGLVEIGEGWVQGTISVQQEHFASNLVIRWLEALIAATPLPTHNGRVLIGCPAGEEHVIIPLKLSLFVRRHNHDVLYLGANIPVEQMLSTIRTAHSDLVVLIAQTLPTAASLLDMATLLQQEYIPFAYGGLVFNQIPNLTHHIPGHFLGTNLKKALETIEHLLTSPKPATAMPQKDSVQQQAHSHYKEHISAIETEVWSLLINTEPIYGHVTNANRYMRQHISAALKLGDMHLLPTDLQWLLPSVPIRTEQRMKYLAIYNKAISTHLDKRGQPIFEWFEDLLGVSANPFNNGLASNGHSNHQEETQLAV